MTRSPIWPFQTITAHRRQTAQDITFQCTAQPRCVTEISILWVPKMEIYSRHEALATGHIRALPSACPSPATFRRASFHGCCRGLDPSSAKGPVALCHCVYGSFNGKHLPDAQGWNVAVRFDQHAGAAQSGVPARRLAACSCFVARNRLFASRTPLPQPNSVGPQPKGASI